MNDMYYFLLRLVLNGIIGFSIGFMFGTMNNKQATIKTILTAGVSIILIICSLCIGEIIWR